MSDANANDEKLAELLRLAALLSDQVLDAQITGQPVPEEQLRALVEAASVLDAHGVPRPPLMAQALHEIGRSASERTGAPSQAGGAGRLARLLGSFRRG